MKVFYFSGTGNSKSVAQKICPEAINIAEIKAGNFEDDSIGFVYPIYCDDMPNIVKNFIKNSTFESGYIWAVATCGGGPGAGLYTAKKLFQEKGKKLSYNNFIIMPDSCIIFNQSKESKEEQLAAEDGKVFGFIKDITTKAVNETDSAAFKKGFSPIMWFFFKAMFGLDKKKAEGCIGCGKCEELCPTKNIKVEDKKVTFGDNCVYCFSCIQHCPVRAIKFGKVKPDDNSGYFHP